jgi:hypothetical protein
MYSIRSVKIRILPTCIDPERANLGKRICRKNLSFSRHIYADQMHDTIKPKMIKSSKQKFSMF